MPQSSNAVGRHNSFAFLAEHPEILTGRDALSRAEEQFGDDTFTIINKPFENMVLIQQFNPDTLRRLFVVALVDDQKALDDYKEQNQDEDGEGKEEEEEDSKGCEECKAGYRAEVEGPDRYLIEQMATHEDTCKLAQLGQMWPVDTQK